MKKTAGILLVFLGAMTALFGADAKQLRIMVGKIATEEVPFKIENISISDPSLVKVEIISENGRNIRISGQSAGVTDIQLIGGGMSQIYKVTIEKDLIPLVNALKRDLDAVSEVDISMNNGRIVLKGELSSIANQELKNKVVKAYGSIVLDLTTFRPTPEVMLGLQQNFEKAGFKVVRNAANSEPGQISITQVGEMLTITGSVYSPEDVKKINVILGAQPWLTVNSNNSANSDGKVQAYVNVQVLPVMLQVDIVHIAISEKEARGMGIDWSDFVNNGFGVGTNLMYALEKVRGADVAKTASSSVFAGTDGTLSAWLKLMGENGVTRARRAGFLTFKSNDTPEFRRMQNGGKLVISSDSGVGSTSTLKEYEYGMILEVKGGLTGVDTVSIELKQELSYPGPISEYVNDAKLDLKKFTTSTSLTAKLGETIAIGGMKEFTKYNTDTASIPYLRNVPVLKWVVSQEDNTFRDDEIITLICIHKMIPAGSIDPVAKELEELRKKEPRPEPERKTEPGAKWYEFWKQSYWKW